MLEGIHHVAIICKDYPQSKHFYTEILGFQLIAENYREARESFKCDLGLPDGTQIELFSFPGSPPRLSRPEAQGLRHLAFRVRNIESVIERLKSHRVECEAVRIDPYTGKKFTFFADPDGLPLELYEMHQTHPA
ncbi:VOC family protein [Alteromonas pelagimontana]|uniref:VOC family protein n=1 Tax=Alteromonas pelagimontana TaxID=1858656 RepID=A0A6M4ME71_9ALTE|nr:VOC family protein [Alteromonas pelagimontana]QJR81402.1 VOC family protein [Alteromonas pelagimontana]